MKVRPFRQMSRVVLALAGVAGCEGTPTGAPIDSASDSTESAEVAVDSVEDAPSEIDLPLPVVPWTPGKKAFVDTTEAWGLIAVEPLGVRLSAVDLDGDGWVDLVSQ